MRLQNAEASVLPRAADARLRRVFPSAARAGDMAVAADIVAAARAGRIFILVDDRRGEISASLVVAASSATAGAINFMAMHARGLVCLALERSRVEHLGLPLQPCRNARENSKPFTVSIEARDGVTTGISALDRARTIAVAIDGGTKACDLNTPGHIFPLVARDQGLFGQPGHVEAAVDVARMAGLHPSAVLCTILGQAGDIASPAEVEALAASHDLPIASIRDLIAYRCQHDPCVERLSTTPFATGIGGSCRMHNYVDPVCGSEAIILQAGDFDPEHPVALHLADVSILSCVPGPGDASSRRLQDVMHVIAGRGAGFIILQAPAPRNAAISSQSLQTASRIMAHLGIGAVELVACTPDTAGKLSEYGIPVSGFSDLAVEPPGRPEAAVRVGR